ncbi:hypothetical protein K438DRAFT_1787724 [Mycena galopus ATCC 62051]|nr:hypothetical protein K438DRAFT_1787724 [Mycena galopus ATCC 62051]
MGRRLRHCMSLHLLVLLDLRIAITLRLFGWDPCHYFIRALVNEELYALCSDASPRARSQRDCTRVGIFISLDLASAPDSVSHGEWVNTTLWSYFLAPALRELMVPQHWFTMGAIQDLDLFFAHNGRVPISRWDPTLNDKDQLYAASSWEALGAWPKGYRRDKRKLLKKAVAFKAAAARTLLRKSWTKDRAITDANIDLEVSRQKALHCEAAYQKALQKAADAVIKHTKKKGQSRRGRKV